LDVGNLIKLLIALLVVQIGLVAWVNRSSDQLDTFSATEPLLNVDAADVDRLIIDEQGKASLVIKREGGQWVLPDQGGFPVSAKKLDGFLKKLLATQSSWPVGRTQVAARQLKVGEDEFERKIRLLNKDGVLGEIYLGSSPGFRKVHARLDGAANTYAIDFNAFDAPTNPADWYDRDFLRLTGADLERIDMGAYALIRGEKGFELEGLAADEQTNMATADQVVRAVTTLVFTDELGEKGKETFERSELVLQFTVKAKDGESVEYTVVSPEEADHYVLKASKYPYHFKVGKKKFDDLRGVDRLQLVEGKAGKAESTAEKKEG